MCYLYSPFEVMIMFVQDLVYLAPLGITLLQDMICFLQSIDTPRT